MRKVRKTKLLRGNSERRSCRARAVMRHQGELYTWKITLQQGESGQGGGRRLSLGNCIYSPLLRHHLNLSLHPSPITTTPHSNEYDQSTGSRMRWREIDLLLLSHEKAFVLHCFGSLPLCKLLLVHIVDAGLAAAAAALGWRRFLGPQSQPVLLVSTLVVTHRLQNTSPASNPARWKAEHAHQLGVFGKGQKTSLEHLVCMC